jgi:transcriptional regulator
MLTTKPPVRIAGHGTRLRLRTRGDWEGDAVAALRESCRASVAVEKAVAEAIQCCRTTGMSWDEIARTLGVAEQAGDKRALIDAFAHSRRAILEHQLQRTT